MDEPVPYKVMVHIIEARGLTGKDESTHVSDALCSVQLGPVSHRVRWTDVEVSTMNPVWDNTFVWENVMLTDDEFHKEKCSVAVMHKNDFWRNQLIGSYEFSLSNVHRQKGHQYHKIWVPLTVPEKPENEAGYLLLTVYVLKPGDPTPLPTEKKKDGEDESQLTVLSQPLGLGERRPYLLNVSIYRGQDILVTQSRLASTLSPFISVRFNNNVIQTPVLGGSSPIWNRRLELPFHLPLRSDSIEVTLWNRLHGRPDERIGGETFNIFKLGLTHKSWGPRWVNLYSSEYRAPQTSLLGLFKDVVESDNSSSSSSSGGSNESEYVGRVLMRMFVEPREETLLMSVPTAPVPDPRTGEFVAHMNLYSASELPVMGGKIAVELVYGTGRRMSSWALGRDGVFRWHETFSEILLFAPLDATQMHSLIINVYHKVGGSQRKIGYERIPARSLLVGREHEAPNPIPNTCYYVNGDTRVTKRNKDSWPTKWRVLSHVHPDRKHAHIVAGYVLCSLGFGLRSHAPTSIPRPILDKTVKHTLRCYIHQGANLLANDALGTSNPTVVVRFAGQEKQLPVQKNTLFPFWYQVFDIVAHVDPKHAPSIHIMVYHAGLLSYTLIGRAEVSAQHVINNPSVLYRYKLRIEDVQKRMELEAERKDDDDKKFTSTTTVSAKSASKTTTTTTTTNATTTSKTTTASTTSTKSTSSSSSSSSSSSPSASSSLPLDSDPYILASFELFPLDDNWRFQDNFPPTMQRVMMKIDAMGVRRMADDVVSLAADSKPKIKLQIPLMPVKIDESASSSSSSSSSSSTTPGATIAQTTNANGNTVGEEDRDYYDEEEGDGNDDDDDGSFTNSALVDESHFETEHYETIVLDCERCKGGASQCMLSKETDHYVLVPDSDPYGVPIKITILVDETVVGVRYLSLAETMATPFTQKRPPSYILRTNDKDSSKGKVSVIEDASKTTIITAEGEAGGDDEDEDERDKVVQLSLVDEDVAGSDHDDEGDEGDSDAFLIDDTMGDSDYVLHVEPARMNVAMTEFAFAAPNAQTEVVKKEEEEEEEEEELKRPKPLEISMFKGRAVALSKSQGQSSFLFSLFSSSSSASKETCVLKCWIRSQLCIGDDAAVKEQFALFKASNLLNEIRPIYAVKFVTRIYVYSGVNLAPTERYLAGYQSANPYLVISNGQGQSHKMDQRERAKRDDLNPDFYQVFELPTQFPQHSMLTISVWNSEDLVSDDLIGTTQIDLESRYLNQEYHGYVPVKDYFDLHNDSSRVSQGKVSMRIEILTEEMARRKKAEDLRPPEPEEFELRAVLWQTRDVRPLVDTMDPDVNQRVVVTTNFTGTPGHDETKQTDVAWYSTDKADFNYRMVWRLRVPVKLPRIRFQMWHENLVADNELIAECLYNLQPFLAKATRDKKPITTQEQEWLQFSHPDYRNLNLGSINCEFALLTVAEAERAPVGEAQNEPNRDPFLKAPARKPPPWAVGSRGANWLAERKALLMAICVIIFLVPLFVPIIVLAVESSAA